MLLLLLCSFLSFGERTWGNPRRKKVDVGEMSKKVLAKKIRLRVLARRDRKRECECVCKRRERERERGKEE